MTDDDRTFPGHVSLEVHYDHRIRDLERFFDNQLVTLEKLFDVHIQSLDEKARLLRESMEHRLSALNENRESLKDITATLLPRIEHDRDLERVNEALQQFRTFKDGLMALATQKSVNISYVLSAIAIVLGVIALFERIYKP
jgi:hypothetical protein